MLGREIQPKIAAVVILASATSVASACEPILPLTQLIAGATAAGPLLFLRSLGWLAIAIAIKCASFAFLEPRLSRTRAVSFMLVANVLSTIPGLLTATFAGALPLLALPMIFGLGLLAEMRVSSFPPNAQMKAVKAKGIALALTAAFVMSFLMFYLAQNALDDHNFTNYWILKTVFAGLAVCVGMGISAVLEEYAIGCLARSTHGQVSFYTSVIRANYLTLGVILLVAAVCMVPKRLTAPNFIVQTRTSRE